MRLQTAMRVVLLTAAIAVLGAAQGPSAAPTYSISSAFSTNSPEDVAPQLQSLSPQTAPEPQPSVALSPTDTKSFSSRPYQGEEFPRGARYVLPDIQPIGLNPPATSDSAQPETAPVPVSGFVQRSGQNFVVNGSVHFFSGSNDYFLILRCANYHSGALRAACSVIDRLQHLTIYTITNLPSRST